MKRMMTSKMKRILLIKSQRKNLNKSRDVSNWMKYELNIKAKKDCNPIILTLKIIRLSLLVQARPRELKTKF